jgi:hypothetical protein
MVIANSDSGLTMTLGGTSLVGWTGAEAVSPAPLNLIVN